MALRLSGAIMELTEDFEKRRSPAHHAGGEQVALGQKRAAQQSWILTLADHPEHALVGLFQIVQKDPLKLAAPVRVLRDCIQLLQGKGEVAFEHLLAKGLWSSEKS
ncbi:MAG: hypothetical protein AB9869_03565 [Verrucomicrobiia bacterium]